MFANMELIQTLNRLKRKMKISLYQNLTDRATLCLGLFAYDFFCLESQSFVDSTNSA